MRLTMSFGQHGSPTVVALGGDLDVAAANQFTHVVLGLRDIIGTDVAYDFETVVVRDDAGRSAMAMISHEFREHGPRVRFPAAIESGTTP